MILYILAAIGAFTVFSAVVVLGGFLVAMAGGPAAPKIPVAIVHAAASRRDVRRARQRRRELNRSLSNRMAN